MFKKTLALILCILSLFAICAVSQAETADDYLAGISGRYIELFPEMSKDEYHQIWLDATAPIVGEENAEAATDKLLSRCMGELYGEDAIALYSENPDSTRFNCYFIGGVAEFVMDGNVITGLDADGNEVFSHSYSPVDMENENGFIFYKSDDANAGQFSYFSFTPDTMESTYHLELRYAENIEDLQSWVEGAYAYWNAAAIAADYSEETMHDVISLFTVENLTSAE